MKKMSTELAMQKDLGMSLAEAVGVTNSDGVERRTSNLARLNLMHKGIMGEIEVDGKAMKTEVVSAGSYVLTQNDEEIFLSNPTVRIFAIRQQYKKWNSDEDFMMKSVMATDLKGDLKDNMGTFNLGRPSGYIKDWDSVPEKTKEIIRNIKRKKIIFGILTASEVVDDQGNKLDAITDPVAFFMEIAPSSIKRLDLAVNALSRKNILPIQHTLTFGAEPGGETYYVMTLDAKERVELDHADQEILSNFLEYITNENAQILDQWEEKNKDSVTEEEAALVAEFVNVEEED